MLRFALIALSCLFSDAFCHSTAFPATASSLRAPPRLGGRFILSALNEAMDQRLKSIERSYNEMTERLADPDVLGDSKLLMSISQERANIESVVEEYNVWKAKKNELEEAKELSDSDDAEIKEMAREEARELEAQIGTLEDSLMILILPRDPNDNKNVIVEVRAGTGGGEANLWAGDLVAAYRKYAESEGWRVSLMEETEGDETKKWATY